MRDGAQSTIGGIGNIRTLATFNKTTFGNLSSVRA
jgi:hypothetical protein